MNWIDFADGYIVGVIVTTLVICFIRIVQEKRESKRGIPN